MGQALGSLVVAKRMVNTQVDAGRPGNSSASAAAAASERALVVAAAAGDHGAFRELIEPVHRELHLFCYRMLGSFEDAEDVLQEALFKAWRALGRYDRRSSFRTWVYRIVTHASLDALRSRRRRVLPWDIGAPGAPASGFGEQRHDIAWLELYLDRLPAPLDPHAAAELRESTRLAFVHALQTLAPRQRAVLILRDVLDWTAAEVATALDTSVAAVNSALQRARGALSGGRDRISTRPAPEALDAKTTEIAALYVAAWEAGDMDAIVSMLTDDVVQAMPPWAAWFVGRETVRALYSAYEVWNGPPGPGVFRVIPASLNGDLVFAEYCRTAPDRPYHAVALTVVSLGQGGTQISQKVSFLGGDLLTRLGFPPVLD